MGPNFFRFAGLRLAFIIGCICVPVMGRLMAVASPAPQGQQAGEVQTGPIDEPRGAQQEPTGPPVVKGIQAIVQREAKCSKRLIINTDALFAPGRWTLNSEAVETLDALAPLIVKAGKHPVRIEAFTQSAASDRDNQIVAEKRAITLRGWLRNHGYVPENTPVEGIGKHSGAPPNTATAVTTKTAVGRDSAREGADERDGALNDQRVEVLIDTCH
ncbi:MAG: OmpA family protein [Candidatus Korobacteraceae bacterium]|jgi:outer membrane protein OmpA-like peptidoglycan-associated protein